MNNLNTPPDYALLNAAESGDLEALKSLIAKGGFNAADAPDDALRYACGAGHQEIVHFLLLSAEMVELHGRCANLRYNQDEPLRWACQNNHLAMVKYLLDDLSHLWPADYVPQNAFEQACSWSCPDIVKWLVRHDKKWPFNFTCRDNGFSVFTSIAAEGDVQTLDLLLTSHLSHIAADLPHHLSNLVSTSINLQKAPILEYLVYQYGLEEHADFLAYPEMVELFEKRKLHESLKGSLPARDNTKKSKI